MDCLGCMACCESLPINDIKLTKPEGVLCVHCDNGCSIYDDRPESCRNFDCMYNLAADMDISLRPDKLNVIFEGITTKIQLALVHHNHIDDWKTDTLMDHIAKLNADGISVVISSFRTGMIDIFTTEAHDRNKVLEIAMRTAI